MLKTSSVETLKSPKNRKLKKAGNDTLDILIASLSNSRSKNRKKTVNPQTTEIWSTN